MDTLENTNTGLMIRESDDMLSELTTQQEKFAQMYAKTGNATYCYRLVYNVAPETSRAVVNSKAHELRHHPAVAARIHVLRAAIAEQFVISAAALQLRQYELATAPPLTHVRVFNCRHCHGVGFGYQWRDEVEAAKAIDESLVSQGAIPMPDLSGGYGFDAFAPVNPQCVVCMGAGKAVVYLADTTQLEGAAAASYAGAEIDKYGIIKIKQHNQQDAAFELHRMVPGAIAPTRSESKSVSVHVEPLKDMTPAEVIELIQQQRLIK